MSHKPTHPMSKEDERIDAVCQALAVSTSCDPRRDEEEEKREAVIDLLTNLQHYAHKHKWDFDDLLQTAQGHFAKFMHPSKTERQLEKDWEKSVAQAKKKGFDWNHSDALLLMADKGWKHEGINTVTLEY